MINRFFKRRLFAQLAKFQHGQLVIVDDSGQRRFGDADSQLTARIQVHHQRLYRRAALGGGIGIAEALADGDWECSDLTALVRIFVLNMDACDELNRGWSVVRQQLERWLHWLKRNTVGNARQNIIRHYDLSNDFFALFLDPSMSYSSAIFSSPEQSLHDASINKLDRVCQKLDLKPSDHLLEIGTGWGALAIHAARHYGCRVTTTTVSEQQYEWARRRIEEANLAHRIELLLRDYRQLSGHYDKLVSIEMIEAVGHQYFDTFFRQCSSLLKPDGEMLLQAITIAEHRFEHHKRSVDFIKSYIFPGGCLPSEPAMLESVSRCTRMRLEHLDSFADHYARTLNLWRRRFTGQLEQVRQLGFSEPFIRLWDYYLAYCEAAFLQRHVNVVQMLFANHQSSLSPLSRNFDQIAASKSDAVPWFTLHSPSEPERIST